ncbi:MAG: hypothetical protein KC636_38375, partial [Myxococcales bacterium]|nr:hypothetical protein [Myxococcales bacterium]
HPMFDAGPVTIPVADARVHVIIPSFQRSVKLSSPLTMQGTMVQDRQPAIGVRADITAEMVPVITHMIPAEPDIQPRDYHSEVASDTALTPGLVAALLVDAASEAGTDAADLTAVVEHTIALETTKGPRTVKLREEAFFPLGADLRELRSTRGILTIAAVLDNDFEVARIRQVEQTVQLTYGDPVDIIEAVRVTQGEVHAGDLLRVTLDIRRRHGELRTETLDLRVPDDAAGEDIEINITGGAYEQPYRPMPDSLDDLIANIERTYPARSMVATLYREQEGLSTKHGLLRDLPDSVLESLTPAGRSTPSVRFKQMARRVIPTKRLIEGDHTIKLSVLPARSFSQP